MSDLITDTGFWGLVAGSAFLLIVLLSVAGAILEKRSRGSPASHAKMGKIMLVVFLLLTVILGCSFVPVMVGTVLGFQEVIGNRGVPLIGFLLDHQAGIILAVWAIMGLGSLIAIPAFLNDAFKDMK